MKAAIKTLKSIVQLKSHVNDIYSCPISLYQCSNKIQAITIHCTYFHLIKLKNQQIVSFNCNTVHNIIYYKGSFSAHFLIHSFILYDGNGTLYKLSAQLNRHMKILLPTMLTVSFFFQKENKINIEKKNIHCNLQLSILIKVLLYTEWNFYQKRPLACWACCFIDGYFLFP